MSLTGGFDLVLQIADPALTTASARMHAQGTLSHRTLRISDGEQFDFVFGPPHVSATALEPDELARVIAPTRMLVRARPVGDLAAVGRTAVAEVSFRARLDSTAAPGDPISADDRLRVDWSETAAGDIVFQRADSGFESDARAAILEMTQEDTGASVPLGALAEAGVNQVVPCTVTAPAGGSSVALGLDLVGGAGSVAVIDSVVRHDWAIALGRDYVVNRLISGLAESFGGAAPPPYGQQALVLDDRVVCLAETPLGCLATARRQLLLRRLDLTLMSGRIVVSGRLAQVIYGPFGFEIDADWSVDVTLHVDASGDVQAQVGTPSVQLAGVLAEFANFFSGGALERAIKDGIVSALQASFDAPEALELVDGLVGRFGQTAAGVGVRAVEIDHRPDGLVLHGIVTVAPQQQPPVATLTALAAVANPLRLVLLTGGSWAPGGDLVRINWEPGGGPAIGTPPTDCRQAVEHDYNTAGAYTVCLELTDGGGRVTRSCERVEVGILRHQLVSPGAREDGAAWKLCAGSGQTVSVDVLVTGGETRLAGVSVTLRGGSWTEAGTTDGQGMARIALDVDQVTHSSAAGGTAPSFNLGGFDVEVAAPGWVGSTRRAWLVDCAAAAALRAEALKARDRWIDRLAGYHELNRIREELGRPRPQPGLSVEGEVPRPPIPPAALATDGGQILDILRSTQRDPRHAAAAGIGAAVEILDQLTNMIATAPSDRFNYDLLGISPKADPKAALKRLDALWKQVDGASRDFQQTYGEPGEPEHPH